MGEWLFRLCPDAGEGGGSFRTAAPKRPGVGGRYLIVDRRDRSVRWAEPGPHSAGEALPDDAIRRARGKVRRYCAANGLNRLGTLTYAGSGNHDPAQLRVDLGRFFRRLRRNGQPFPYLWVPEWHPGGHGLHAHFAVGQYIPRRAIERAWGHGFVHISLLGDLPVGAGVRGEARLAARYLAKYVGKDLGETASALHRYEVAQGFQPKVVGIKAESGTEALGWASIVMSAAPVHVWWSRDEEDWVGPPAVWALWA